MNKTIVFMYSGQGSQYYGMGKELYTTNAVFRKWMNRLDEIHADLTGKSVLNVLYDDTKKSVEPFDSLLYTHPAIFMVEYALTQVLLENGLFPDIVLGTSLGECASIAAAGCLSDEDTIRCIVKQAQLVEASCQRGGMLAVIGDSTLYNSELLLHSNSELVSVNYDSHFIVSGSCEQLEIIEEVLKAKEVICQRLPVQFAFHSPRIDPIALEYTDFLKQMFIKRPTINIISSAYGGHVTTIDNGFLWDVVRNPIHFRRALNVIGDGEERIYIDLGPMGTLSNFVKYNFGADRRAQLYSVMTPYKRDLQNLQNLLCISQ
ncbi:acyltransferase domain-containing protein [Paenibacillus xylaniclasticus]|uniref:acyltransferase domain-containing protein n=1 Tax=Paenibacillus xylaniclasticus TaxID=588083 RepID=UPI0015B9E432|nr:MULTISPECIES: acyltransferase domain-containing protein [Paenibacillus]GFN30067.1 polyketide biosynthesis acyltransferase PksD [Paenibacillus curdlanolyticus]